MAKFNFVFALALFAFAVQASNGASFNNPNNNILREVTSGHEMQQLIEEVNKLIQDVSSGLYTVLQGLTDKHTELLTEANLPAIVEQLQKDIAELTQDNSVPEICSSAAKYEVNQLEKLVQEDSFTCDAISLEEDEKVNELRRQLQAVIYQLGGFVKSINEAVLKCFRNSEGSLDKFSVCMRGALAQVQQQVMDLEVIAMKALDALKDLVPEIEDKIAQCVQQAKETVQHKAQTAVDDLKKCSQVETPVTLRKLCWPNVDIPICDDYDWSNGMEW